MPLRYYIPELVANPLTRARLRWFSRRRPAPEFPPHAQIQTVSGCNANCAFCPNRKTERDIRPGQKMPMELFQRIADELLAGPVKRISPYLMNEPLLDPRLPERIAYVTAHKRQGQFTKINSHGGLLNERMARELLDSGLDRLNFSVHGIEPESYEQTMGLPLERVLTNIDRLLELKRDGGYRLPRIRIAMLVTTALTPQLPKIREYWGARGIKINLNQLENRGNHPSLQTGALAPRELLPFDWCNRMFEQIYILHDGRAVLCCADWEQRAEMGNAARQTIREIWNGPRYREFRRRFIQGDVAGMLCEGCTKDAAGEDDDAE